MADKPQVFVNQAKTPEGVRYWAEVVVDAGQPTEAVLYSTQMYDRYRPARMDALEWIRRNTPKRPLM